MSQYLDTLFQEQDNIEHEIRRIRKMANTFDDMGMARLVDTTYDIADKLEKSITSISNTVSAEVNHGYQQSLQSSNAMLSAVLAMSTLAEVSHTTQQDTQPTVLVQGEEL